MLPLGIRQGAAGTAGVLERAARNDTHAKAFRHERPAIRSGLPHRGRRRRPRGGHRRPDWHRGLVLNRRGISAQPRSTTQPSPGHAPDARPGASLRGLPDALSAQRLDCGQTRSKHKRSRGFVPHFGGTLPRSFLEDRTMVTALRCERGLWSGQDTRLLCGKACLAPEAVRRSGRIRLPSFELSHDE